jgi:hypothetical protein
MHACKISLQLIQLLEWHFLILMIFIYNPKLISLMSLSKSN